VLSCSSAAVSRSDCKNFSQISDKSMTVITEVDSRDGDVAIQYNHSTNFILHLHAHYFIHIVVLSIYFNKP